MKPNVKTSSKAFPMIYAYSTPQIREHDGWTKIGYTELNTVTGRINDQGHELDVIKKEEWRGNAVYDDGTGETFTDKAFHAYLDKLGIENIKGTEWYHVDGKTGKQLFYQFRSDHGIIKAMDAVPYNLRDEQEAAVAQTANYQKFHPNGEFLWNAKPRFGKTLSVYDFCKRIKAQNVLIVTNRPAIANSWYSDYCQFMGDASGFKFVSETDSLKGQAHVLSRDEYAQIVGHMGDSESAYGCIEFLSLQDLKGSKYFGGKFEKLQYIKDIKWDLLVIDEAHEGIDTLKTDVAFDRIHRKFTLHLSGTPFKALANDKFPEQAIYNWTYADEQKAKRDWDYARGSNPYENLPRLNMYTYQMSEIIKDMLSAGIEINGETEEYAFDLGLFFSTDGRGRFVYDDSVDQFLSAMTTQEKFPFSTPELRNELKHTFWLLNRVESARALAKKLQVHPIFKEYEIILAAGDGKMDGEDEKEIQKSFNRVKEAISHGGKTITLSVGQLTTGITVPEWTAVLMLSNVKSPALYMQAAFRAQNPCLFKSGKDYYRKQNAYVFDFDPARTLTIFEEFANDLSANTAAGRGDLDQRRQNIRELLNFFPVIGEDEDGEMIELDAEKVLSIPRKIRSQEVVKRGFMSNYLFQNISNIFNAPQSVIDILSGLPPADEPKGDIAIDGNTGKNLGVDPETGEVGIPEEQVIGTAADIFGEPIYDTMDETLDTAIQSSFNSAESETDHTSAFDEFSSTFKKKMVSKIVETAKAKYGDQIKSTDAKRMEKNLGKKFDAALEKEKKSYEIDIATAEGEYQTMLEQKKPSGQKLAEAQEAYQVLLDGIQGDIEERLRDMAEDFIHTTTREIVESVEKNRREKEKNAIEETIRDHLRGFTRTIPSFLMAYGNDQVSLSTFDTIVPDTVFREVTSISLADFCLLRDGGDILNEETGEMEYFQGNLFDPVVFDDSVKEFMRLKKALADYFDETSKEDIFDFIPTQKTNQIYTPKKTVKEMADLLEKENPGCFDDPHKTFIDLYMKSGLYITEIVKRLFQSETMKKLYPDESRRLNHIFAEQVYGLAPTEIIYNIAKSYILGFSDEIHIEKHNLKLADALPAAKEGKLPELLEQLYG